MTILLYEDNLMWSPRLSQTVRALGLDPHVITATEKPRPAAQFAIVNLGTEAFRQPQFIQLLQSEGIKVIGHAGHKETQLLQFGSEAGCDYLATNSEITFKLKAVLAKLQA
jgi:hypothetical protein